MIYRASTNEQTFEFDFDVSGMTEIQITYRQKREIVLEKHMSDLSFSDDGCDASFVMTQEEANLFTPGFVSIQARLYSEEGDCMPTETIHELILDVQHDNIITGG